MKTFTDDLLNKYKRVKRASKRLWYLCKQKKLVLSKRWNVENMT